jgi:hypothetical protein
MRQLAARLARHHESGLCKIAELPSSMKAGSDDISVPEGQSWSTADDRTGLASSLFLSHYVPRIAGAEFLRITL